MSRCIFCLQDLPIFEGLEVEDFSNVCLTATKKMLEKGEYLFHQGDLAETMYLIKTGTIKLVQYTEEGKEIILDIIGRGDVLGETALFKQQNYLTSAIAVEKVKVCSISLGQFEKLITAKPSIAVKIIANLGQKLYSTMQQVGDIANHLVADKVIRILLRLAREYGEETSGGQLIELHLTQQDLANMVGSSRVMVAQVLKNLKARGIITKKGKYYLLQDQCLEKHFK